MSEYVSMRSIQLKNQLMTPQVLQAYRSGTLNYDTVQQISSPLQEIYTNTYNYSMFPPELSDQALRLVQVTNGTKLGDIQGLSQSIARNALSQ